MEEVVYGWTHDSSPKEEALGCPCASIAESNMVDKGCLLGVLLSYNTEVLADKPSMSLSLFDMSSTRKSLSKEEITWPLSTGLGSKIT